MKKPTFLSGKFIDFKKLTSRLLVAVFIIGMVFLAGPSQVLADDPNWTLQSVKIELRAVDELGQLPPMKKVVSNDLVNCSKRLSGSAKSRSNNGQEITSFEGDPFSKEADWLKISWSAVSAKTAKGLNITFSDPKRKYTDIVVSKDAQLKNAKGPFKATIKFQATYHGKTLSKEFTFRCLSDFAKPELSMTKLNIMGKNSKGYLKNITSEKPYKIEARAYLSNKALIVSKDAYYNWNVTIPGEDSIKSMLRTMRVGAGTGPLLTLSTEGLAEYDGATAIINLTVKYEGKTLSDKALALIKFPGGKPGQYQLKVIGSNPSGKQIKPKSKTEDDLLIAKPFTMTAKLYDSQGKLVPASKIQQDRITFHWTTDLKEDMAIGPKKYIFQFDPKSVSQKVTWTPIFSLSEVGTQHWIKLEVKKGAEVIGAQTYYFIPQPPAA